MGFVWDLIEAGSTGSVEEAGTQRFNVDVRAGNRLSQSLRLVRSLQVRTFVVWNFRTLKMSFVGSADFTNAFHHNAHSWMVTSVVCTPHCSRIRSWLRWKMVNQERLAPDSLMYLVPATLTVGFSWAMCFCQDVTDQCTLGEC